MVIGKSYRKSNDKDAALAMEIAKAWCEGRCPEVEGSSLASVHSNPQCILSSYIAYALTTIREEARRAAFKEAVDAINAVPMSRYWSDSGEEIARSFHAQAIRRVEAALEAAEKGERDG